MYDSDHSEWNRPCHAQSPVATVALSYPPPCCWGKSRSRCDGSCQEQETFLCREARWKTDAVQQYSMIVCTCDASRRSFLFFSRRQRRVQYHHRDDTPRLPVRCYAFPLVVVKTFACTPRQVLYNPRKYGLDQPYDVITVTPPYEEVVYSDLVTALAASDVSVGDGGYGMGVCASSSKPTLLYCPYVGSLLTCFLPIVAGCRGHNSIALYRECEAHHFVVRDNRNGF